MRKKRAFVIPEVDWTLRKGKLTALISQKKKKDIFPKPRRCLTFSNQTVTL